MIYDCIIVGMGASGMSAAIYAKRSGLNILMIEKNTPGGVISRTNIVENYLGYESIKGSDLAYNMFMHTQNEEIPFVIEEVERIINNGETKTLITTEKSYETKTVIISGGRQPRKTNLENEEQLMGHGLSYCAVCDAPLYKNKEVAVIGGGNSAIEEGIYLSEFVSKLYIIYRGEKLRADKFLVDKIKEKENVEIIYNTTVKEIVTKEEKIEKLILNNDSELKVDGVFVFIGYEPVTRYLSELNIVSPEGYIEVDENMCTNCPGVFASGDVIKKDVYQIITAASEGAVAAIGVKKYIGGLKE